MQAARQHSRVYGMKVNRMKPMWKAINLAGKLQWAILREMYLCYQHYSSSMYKYDYSGLQLWTLNCWEQFCYCNTFKFTNTKAYDGLSAITCILPLSFDYTPLVLKYTCNHKMQGLTVIFNKQQGIMCIIYVCVILLNALTPRYRVYVFYLIRNYAV